ncbi:hypothetical protein [Paraburkholderia caballeronis]|uniref:hypothetical protein n=1 Tax=Paraburkholderia caballeronis TaxID=416943 RepID=UPI001064DEE5|nr:hypothetical protein [Paraburkholderia caballeronis]
MGIDRQWNNCEVDDRPESAAQEAWRQIRPRIAERFGSATPIVENFDAVVSNDVVIVVMGPAPYALLRGGVERHVGERRLLKIRGILLTGAGWQPLLRLVERFGFRSAAHFSRAFRTRSGYNPSGVASGFPPEMPLCEAVSRSSRLVDGRAAACNRYRLPFGMLM